MLPLNSRLQLIQNCLYYSPQWYIKIVEGAVGMVDSALALLSEKNIIELDDEKKAAMVSNLMVVLCSDKEATPVLNTGTLNT